MSFYCHKCHKRITPITISNELVCPTCKQAFIEDASNVDDVIVTQGAAVAEGSASPHGFQPHSNHEMLMNDDLLDEVLNTVHTIPNSASSRPPSSSPQNAQQPQRQQQFFHQQQQGPFFSFSYSSNDPNNPTHFTSISGNNANPQAAANLNAMLEQMFGLSPNMMQQQQQAHSQQASANQQQNFQQQQHFFPFMNPHQYGQQQQQRPMNFVDMFDQVFNSMGMMQQQNGSFTLGDYVLGDNLDHILARLAEQMNGPVGTPPAAKEEIEKLQHVKITQKDVDNNEECAVCQDKYKLDEQVLKMPCSHIFHDECLMPWLKLHCSCPVCRKELKTDDKEYEARKQQQAQQQPNQRPRQAQAQQQPRPQQAQPQQAPHAQQAQAQQQGHPNNNQQQQEGNNQQQHHGFWHNFNWHNIWPFNHFGHHNQQQQGAQHPQQNPQQQGAQQPQQGAQQPNNNNSASNNNNSNTTNNNNNNNNRNNRGGNSGGNYSYFA